MAIGLLCHDLFLKYGTCDTRAITSWLPLRSVFRAAAIRPLGDIDAATRALLIRLRDDFVGAYGIGCLACVQMEALKSAIEGVHADFGLPISHALGLVLSDQEYEQRCADVEISFLQRAAFWEYHGPDALLLTSGLQWAETGANPANSR